ncbi:glycosyltransferase [Cyclobacterium plantarum]|uniref:glycosyltransferase n=1 Tax=Cyclobacterium plantarum TaxID=2716263 RepID=UPI003F7248E4
METIYKLDLSEEFCKWLDEYQPDIIYAQAHGRNRVKFCSRVKQYSNKPMVFHMMDDWPEFVRGESIFGKYWEKVVDKEFKKLLEVSDLHLGISELMEVEYLRRYNIRFKAFHNPIDFDFWRKGQKSNWQIQGENPKILYAGRMGLGIEKSLKFLAEAISIINKKSGRSIQFILQVSEKKKWMNKFKCIKHRPFVPYEELPEKFGEADILYLPYDFSEKAVKFIKYSMPTKASEYMISGTPILIFAPGDTALVNYAEKYQWAKVVKDEDMQELISSLEKLLDFPKERERYGKAAILLAKEKHEAIKVRNDFRKALISVID